MPIIASAGAHAYMRREYPGTPTPHQPWPEIVEANSQKWHAHVERLKVQLADEIAATKAQRHYEERKAEYGMLYDWYLEVEDATKNAANIIRGHLVQCFTRQRPPPPVVHPWQRRPVAPPEGALKEGEKESRFIEWRYY
ncbi:hypothetical protein EDC01DRAFT_630689 [Geopyxis carbonaria]|nr:hypothetical protein EDC01DRAFT_630689 [Geopyxis carbonaria]